MRSHDSRCPHQDQGWGSGPWITDTTWNHSQSPYVVLAGRHNPDVSQARSVISYVGQKLYCPCALVLLAGPVVRAFADHVFGTELQGKARETLLIPFDFNLESFKRSQSILKCLDWVCWFLRGCCIQTGSILVPESCSWGSINWKQHLESDVPAVWTLLRRNSPENSAVVSDN